MTIKNNDQEEHSGFLRRWSNRKISSQTEDAAENEIGVKEELNKSLIEETPVNKAEVQQLKTDEDMPPLEDLTEESNFSDFLSPNVSEFLRKQALRKLFHMPFLNVVDDLDDYAEDYTKFAALGDIIPHEMKRMLEREKAKELEEQKQQALDETDGLDEMDEEEIDEQATLEHEDEEHNHEAQEIITDVVVDSEIEAPTPDELTN